MTDDLIAAMLEQWTALWAAAAVQDPRAPGLALQDIGLHLEPPGQPRQWEGYDTTPTEAVTFAMTGGDGVHYSGLTATDNHLVIVVTVPMQPDRPNIVVGRTIHEFLRLGCRHDAGYFALDQLAYDWDAAVEEIESDDNGPSDPYWERWLAPLRQHLHLEPWQHPRRSRLEHLQTLLPLA